MSESMLSTSANATPNTIYLSAYQSPAFFIDTVDLDIALVDDVTTVKSHLSVRRNVERAHHAADLQLHGEELQLETIYLNNVLLKSNEYSINEKELIIYNVPDDFELKITVKIFPQKNTALMGLYRSRNTYCTQCEAEGFRRITYFLDQPDVLARYTVTISADATSHPVLLSNGNLIASGKLENNRHWVKWEDPFKKPSYLFALVAGDFDLLEDKFVTMSKREVALKVYVDRGYREQAHHAMYALKEAMRWDEKAYGREYDLNIYMIVAIGDFTMGAMENKGLNIFNTKFVLAEPATATDDDYIHIISVIGHEYFHNWSGNRVTCRDWFQLSLKEGLTIFRDQSFSEDVLSRAVMRIRDVVDLRETQFTEDAGPLAHPVRPDSYIEINNFYTSTIYNKGAEVLRMLQTILGKQIFRKGMDLYFRRHDGHAVTIDDFVKAMEDVSGDDLTQFRRWYSQAGTPVLTVDDDYDATTKTYSLTIHQQTPATPGQSQKLPLHIPIKIGLLHPQDGSALTFKSTTGEVVNEEILNLRDNVQTFNLKEISVAPIPSLLRNFSAPVKISHYYSDAQLVMLGKYDSDPFNRWEAIQQYTLHVALQLVRDYRQSNPMSLPPSFVELFQHLLTSAADDLFYLAELLQLPSEKYIGEQMQIVDVEAIHAAREFILSELAKQLQPLLLATYQKHHQTSAYQFDMQSVGQRQLKNRCLSYLLLSPEQRALAMQQFTQSLSTNMTDTIPALMGLVNQNCAERTQALEQFYQTWQHDALVMDKWFALQASTKLPTALDDVRRLMQHKAFDLKNPNKVYALIGTFGQRNLINFHARGGQGYVFLREVVQSLDKLNPQVAARMVKPLTTWKRYDQERQVLMQAQLELLLQDKKLSTDLYELVSKSLE